MCSVLGIPVREALASPMAFFALLAITAMDVYMGAYLLGKMKEDRARSYAKLLADAAHELQAPIAILRGNFELVKDFFPHELRSAARVMETTLEDMARLTSNVLAGASCDVMYRLPSAQQAAISAASLLEEVCDDCVILGRDKGVDISWSCESMSIRGDKGKLKEVLLNLVGNALKHTPRGGRISIVGRQWGGYAEIAVADTGSGIAPEFLPHIFERFYRIHEGAIAGTGIGLDLCKKIVEAHGGAIVVKSEAGKGSCFVIKLRLHLL